MALATITSKGQVTIPKAVRDSLRLGKGDKIEFVLTKKGEVILRPVSKKVDDVFGMLHKAGRKAFTPEEMDSAVAAKFREGLK
jgi:AbrB family looped-hinge helix DNA binding protein